MEGVRVSVEEVYYIILKIFNLKNIFRLKLCDNKKILIYFKVFLI